MNRRLITLTIVLLTIVTVILFNWPHPRAPLIEHLTKDVDILPIHSHNDEWRDVPLFDALKHGARAIEPDCWWASPDQILVGHNSDKLRGSNTLKSMYLDHLFSLLQEANRGIKSERKSGVFYNFPESSLFLVIDIKNNQNKFAETLMKLLEPFINANYLSFYDTQSETFKEGPITVIASGELPYEFVSHQSVRYIFLDAPIDEILKGSKDYPAKKISITSTGSLKQLLQYDSVRCADGLTQEQISQLESVIDKVHKTGLMVRFWNTPSWPQRVRNKVWMQLWESGSDIINVDDLKGVKDFF